MFTTENKDGKWWVVEVVTEPLGQQHYLDPNARKRAIEYPKQYPTLPEHASHWAALQGKMFGEGEFDVKEIGCYAGRDGECNWKGCPQLRDNEPHKTGRHCPLDLVVELEDPLPLYAIPKQAEERRQVEKWWDNKQSLESQPAIPASDEEGWEEVEKYMMQHLLEPVTKHTITGIFNYLSANYHPPKRKQ